MGFELGFAYGFGSIRLILTFSMIHTFVTYLYYLISLNQKRG